MLESALKEQLKGIFAGLEANFTFDISVSSSHENRTELVELLGDVADCSDHITCVVNEGSRLKFALLKNGDRTGITFREELVNDLIKTNKRMIEYKKLMKKIAFPEK